MTRLIDGLLNLAKADYGKEEISMREVRLDELLLDARELILRAHPEYSIDLLFCNEEEDDDSLITVSAEHRLLESDREQLQVFGEPFVYRSDFIQRQMEHRPHGR